MTAHMYDRADADRPDMDRPDSERDEVRKQLQKRREFGSHVVGYVVVNLFLVLVWFITGGGYFWPAWVLAGWGIGLVMHGYEAFVQRPVTDADIDAELARRRRPGR